MRIRRLQRRIHLATGVSVRSLWQLPAAGGAPSTALVLAHGAGGDMNDGLLADLALALARAGRLVVRFNFPYRERDGRRPPDPAPRLEETWRAVTARVRTDPRLAPRRLFIGGKSMGGRMASRVVAGGEPADGLVLLGYPLHPPKRSDRLRADHLADIPCPALFIQGTRDALCDLRLLRVALRTMPDPRLHLVREADHAFRVPRRTGRGPDKVFSEIRGAVVSFLGGAP